MILLNLEFGLEGAFIESDRASNPIVFEDVMQLEQYAEENNIKEYKIIR